MQFRVLGPLEIETDDGLLELRGAKQRALLAMLLIHANEVVPRDLLIEGLWGEAAGERAAHNLEAQVSRLRKILREGGRELLLTRPTGYQLSLEADQLDLFRFHRLLEQASAELEAGTPDRAAATFRQASRSGAGGPSRTLPTRTSHKSRSTGSRSSVSERSRPGSKPTSPSATRRSW